jgi:hypothetical protein
VKAFNIDLFYYIMKRHGTFGDDYMKIVSDVLHYGSSDPAKLKSDDSKSLAEAVNKELGVHNFKETSVEYLLAQSTSASKLDHRRVNILDGYAIPVIEVNIKDYHDNIGTSRASAYTSGMPFILTKEGVSRKSDLMHEAGHIVYEAL